MTKLSFASAALGLTLGTIALGPVHASAAPMKSIVTTAPAAHQRLRGNPQGLGAFFEVYPTPQEILINLINNPPNCDCLPPWAIGMDLGTMEKELGQPTSLNGNVAVWVSNTEAANGNLKIASKERLTVTLDANGRATGFQSTFSQSQAP